MKYAVLVGNEKFEIRDGDFKVNGNPIIKVTHVGVCGTDMSYWKNGDDYKDIVIGHEYTGIIEDPGNTNFRKGQRVVGHTQNNFNEPCGHCQNCLKGDFDNCTNRKIATWKGGELSHPGAYSELTTWFPKSIFPLPENLPNDEAALIEPFTVGLHAVRISDIKPGDKVLILGGGIIGLTVAEWVRTFGAAEITISEVNPIKIKNIISYGSADHVVNGLDENIQQQLQDISKGGYDIMIDCVGVPSAFDVGLKALKKEKKMRFTGVALPNVQFPIDYHALVFNEIIFKGSKGQTLDEFKMVMNAIANNKISVKKYITKRIKLHEIQQTFETAKKEGGIDTKILIEM